MAFFTKTDARAAARDSTYGWRSHASILTESMESIKESDTFDVFLSHSSRDAELINGVKKLLEQQDLSVYVDWIVDPQLDRNRVTKETAKHLRGRMRQCTSLIYVATTNSASSLWMPWELGYFDGLRNENVAILPLTDTANEEFRGLEYLGLYPLVENSRTYSGSTTVFIKSPGRGISSLSAFASGQPRWRSF